MITEELIDELVQRFQGWNRTGDHGLLRFLNSAHEILMSVDSEQTTIFDTATGALPILATTAGVFNYIMPDNVRRVAKVLFRLDNKFNFPQSNYGLDRYTGMSQKNGLSIGGQWYGKIPFVRTKDRTSATLPAEVMFTQDPDTQSTLYYLLSYRVPKQILSENIEHEVPTPYDYDFLLPAAAKLIEGQLNGNYDEARRIVGILK
jgi:hypothetical protein